MDSGNYKTYGERDYMWFENCKQVVCINNSGYEFELTRFKVYEKQEDVKANVFSPIGIINDLGNRFNYDDFRFVSNRDHNEIS